MDSRIEVYQNKENLGIRNFGKLLEFVKNKYYMFCDQDDIWLENKVEDTYKKLVDEKADLVFTDLEVVDENLNTISKSFNRLKNIYRKITKFEDIRRVYLYNVVTGCTMLSKSKYIKDILPLPNNKDILYDHYIPLVVYLRGGKVVYLDKPTIKYRQHLNNQVGAKKYTSSLRDYDSIRNHLINVKVSIFGTYVSVNHIFPKNMQEKNKKYLEYFNSLNDIKNISFKNFKLYFQIYKNETLQYKLFYFFMFHVPCVCKVGYKIVSIFKKK
jgi:rhamnosyltransferase